MDKFLFVFADDTTWLAGKTDRELVWIFDDRALGISLVAGGKAYTYMFELALSTCQTYHVA